MSKKWVAVRNGEPCGIFDNRKKAVRWFKDLLEQTLADFKRQDKFDEFDYPIEIPHLTIKPMHERTAELSLC
ncbi:MAG: hypothetical protein ACTSQA_00365, partial [Candidatus Heimdallarchaeaceae archaeon]